MVYMIGMTDHVPYLLLIFTFIHAVSFWRSIICIPLYAHYCSSLFVTDLTLFLLNKLSKKFESNNHVNCHSSSTTIVHSSQCRPFASTANVISFTSDQKDRMSGGALPFVVMEMAITSMTCTSHPTHLHKRVGHFQRGISILTTSGRTCLT